MTRHTSNRRFLKDDNLRLIIIERLPKLIEKEPHLRDYLTSLISHEKFADKKTTESEIKELLNYIKEQNKRLEEHSQVLKEQNKRLEEHSKRLEEHSQILQEQNKRLEELSRRSDELLLEVKNIKLNQTKTIGALGARWGLMSEKSFRNGMKAILEEHFPLKVERYRAIDKEGEVFGHPDQVEMDIIIRNGKTIAVEIKSSISKGDVSTFYRKIKFYEKAENRKVNCGIIISPMVDSRALELAKKFEFQVYAEPEETKFDD